MPSICKEDPNSSPNWRLVLDEITSIRERIDELTRGQKQIQQSLATKANGIGGSPASGHCHRSQTSVLGASTEDNTSMNRFMRKQMTKKMSDRLHLEASSRSLGGQSKPGSRPSNCTIDTQYERAVTKVQSTPQVNHFVAMAEKELKFVFDENTKMQNKKLELNDHVQKKCRRVTQRYAGDLLSTASDSRYLHRLVKIIHSLSAENLELCFDSVVGLIIFLNAVFVGISMDAKNSTSGAYLVIDIIFGCIFWAEVLIKLRVHGCRQRYCCGRLDEDSNKANLIDIPPSRVSCGESFSNCFDLTLVLVDTVQLTSVGFPEANNLLSGGISASLFRVVRLLRLARILRLLRAQIFRDLLSMIQGMMGGLSTLCWSLLLFVLFIYVVALVFREIFGPDKNEEQNDISNTDAKWYFRNVLRSMFTVFRCSFGDCSTAGGTPIFESVVEGKAGVLLGFVYCGFVFVVIIGLFNVISAIFVESTLAAAAGLAIEKQRSRLDNPTRWAVNFIKLLLALMKRLWPGDKDFLDALSNGKLTQPILERLLEEHFSRELFDETLETDGNAQQALEELDIETADHRYLSDILDPDNSGTIGVFELIDGLQRLRGDPRRSDIIAVDLMVRSIQMKIDDIWEWTRNPFGDATEASAIPRGEYGSSCDDDIVEPIINKETL